MYRKIVKIFSEGEKRLPAIRLQFAGYPASTYIDNQGGKRKHKITQFIKKDKILHIYNIKAMHKERAFTTKKEGV